VWRIHTGFSAADTDEITIQGGEFKHAGSEKGGNLRINLYNGVSQPVSLTFSLDWHKIESCMSLS